MIKGVWSSNATGCGAICEARRDVTFAPSHFFREGGLDQYISYGVYLWTFVSFNLAMNGA